MILNMVTGPEFTGGQQARPTIGGAFTYESVAVTEDNLELVRHQVLPIYQDNLRRNQFLAVDRVRERVKPGAQVRFALSPNGRRVGFVSYFLKSIPVDDHRVLLADVAAKVVEEEFQRMGIGTRLSVNIILEDLPDAISGKTANPFAYLANIRTGFIQKAFPNEENYPPKLQRALVVAIGRDLFTDKGEIRMDQRTGLWKDVYRWPNIYPLEEVKVFDIDQVTNPQAFAIMEEWKSPRIGMNPEYDAIQYWLKIDKRLVNQVVRRESNGHPLAA